MNRYSKRLLGTGICYYHVMSRVVDRRFALGKVERETFRRMLGQHLGFAGIECVTFCLMSNHFHLLLRVPTVDKTADLDDDAIIDRFACLYTAKQTVALRSRLHSLRTSGKDVEADELCRSFTRRMHDLSVFMQELKSRFTRWLNQRHDRRGTLWEQRFTSVLVEGSERALEIVAAYIDLNPVRAGIVADPKHYRHCGYAEAVEGVQNARDGLRRALTGGRGDRSWSEVHARYRTILYGADPLPENIDRESLATDRSLTGILHHRIRHFADGQAIGSPAFLSSVVDERDGGFRRMPTGRATALPFENLEGICAMREPRGAKGSCNPSQAALDQRSRRT